MQMFLAAIGGFVGMLALLATNAMWKGYVLTVLWAWFVVPPFGLPQLGLPQAIGLALVVGFLTHQMQNCVKKKQDTTEKWIESVMAVILLPLFALGTGWVVKQFI